MGDVMSDKFVASNGIEVHINEYTQLCISSGRPAEHTQAARGFFQHEAECGEYDQRIQGWETLARHRVFAECYAEEGPLGQAMLRKLDSLSPAPWRDAKPDEVWKFTSKDRERKALAWRSWDDWDVLSPHGRQLRAVDDPIAALIENGYEEFAELASAVRMTEVSNVAE